MKSPLRTAEKAEVSAGLGRVNEGTFNKEYRVNLSADLQRKLACSLQTPPTPSFLYHHYHYHEIGPIVSIAHSTSHNRLVKSFYPPPCFSGPADCISSGILQGSRSFLRSAIAHKIGSICGCVAFANPPGSRLLSLCNDPSNRALRLSLCVAWSRTVLSRALTPRGLHLSPVPGKSTTVLDLFGNREDMKVLIFLLSPVRFGHTTA